MPGAKHCVRIARPQSASGSHTQEVYSRAESTLSISSLLRLPRLGREIPRPDTHRALDPLENGAYLSGERRKRGSPYSLMCVSRPRCSGRHTDLLLRCRTACGRPAMAHINIVSLLRGNDDLSAFSRTGVTEGNVRNVALRVDNWMGVPYIRWRYGRKEGTSLTATVSKDCYPW